MSNQKTISYYAGALAGLGSVFALLVALWVVEADPTFDDSQFGMVIVIRFGIAAMILYGVCLVCAIVSRQLWRLFLMITAAWAVMVLAYYLNL